MNKTSQIAYFKNSEIDYEKWDSCLSNAPNKNLYAQSWFLDIVSPGWGALVFGDYEYIMPLPSKKKFGFRIVLQPLHCQQLGIFPTPEVKIQKDFSEVLYRIFPIIRYQLNSKMNIEAFAGFSSRKKSNYLLPLDSSYEGISSGFSTNTKRNLKVSAKEEVQVIKGLAASEYFISKKNIDRKTPKISYEILNRLMTSTITSGNGVIYTAYSKRNTLCAAAFIIMDGSRLYYLNAFSTDEGRENRAMYSIVDYLIKEFCKKELFIDFEGSVIDGVARFYGGFGAKMEDYYFIHKNPKFFSLGKIKRYEP